MKVQAHLGVNGVGDLGTALMYQPVDPSNCFPALLKPRFYNHIIWQKSPNTQIQDKDHAVVLAIFFPHRQTEKRRNIFLILSLTQPPSAPTAAPPPCHLLCRVDATEWARGAVTASLKSKFAQKVAKFIYWSAKRERRGGEKKHHYSRQNTVSWTKYKCATFCSVICLHFIDQMIRLSGKHLLD